MRSVGVVVEDDREDSDNGKAGHEEESSLVVASEVNKPAGKEGCKDPGKG
jgi:hypothetical protein